MTRWTAAIVVGVALAAGVVSMATATPRESPWSAIGREATPGELAAWDIDVRTDLVGLPPGKGSVDEGMVIWEARCANCHGTFGESNDVFTPIVGGTDEADIARGRAAGLITGQHPHRTTLMKLSQISTLWDYINRAQPWNAPKSLDPDEVYAVIAYILNLGEIVDSDFVLSNNTIGLVQQRLPNRYGLARFEGLWRVDGTPDVQGSACMMNCTLRVDVTSVLPAHARDAHGNPAEQHRIIGPVRGVDTTQPGPASFADTQSLARTIGLAATPSKVDSPARAQTDGESLELARKLACLGCHSPDQQMIGPAFTAVAYRYRNRDDATEYLVDRVRHGAKGNWGDITMPGNPQVTSADAKQLVVWILGMGS